MEGEQKSHEKKPSPSFPFSGPLLLSSCTVGIRRASSEGSGTSSKEDAASFIVLEPSPSSASSSLAKVSQETWVAQINNAGYVNLFGSMTLRAVVTLNGQEEIPYQEQIAEMDEGKLHLVTHSSSGSTEYYLKIDKEDGSYLLSSYSRYGGTWSGQSEDAYIYLNRLYPHKNDNGDWQADIYICPGEGLSLVVSDSAEDVL